ncbi:EAL domain-containing response regulator [Thalassospira sp. HF15]|uniref:EAL domain-containing response regulator n=1 Tax=Thalassospira sp. HF15 TaxID=2722755 RepID=UPI001430BBD9|nr:EAL domain-containing response regulator [Thalassospira sp. HF15]NIY75188.1 EAL domain-containing response regulator [Thalassospira sp. HF15]
MDKVEKQRPVVLMVDDDEKLLAAVRRTLSVCFEFVTHTDGQAALDWLAQNRERTDLIIADLVMPDLDGISFLKQSARMAPSIHRVLLSGNVSNLSLREAINQAMVTRVLAKPISVADLKESIDRILNADMDVKKAPSGPSALMVNNAIDRADFHTVLQPRFRASDLGLCGAEVLCRMPSLEKEFGIDEIFESCQDNPVINRLGSQLMAIMVDQAPRYSALLGDQANLAVNLAAFSLKTPQFFELILRFYEKMRMRGVHVTFEIPERQLLSNDLEMLANATRLRERGIGLLIDDFGSGNNSLDLLRHEVFAGIKLDRDLVRGIMTDFLDDAFVEWIAQVCSKMGLSISAKGIENAKIAEKLQLYGITELQGFHLGTPVPLELWEETAMASLQASG